MSRPATVRVVGLRQLRDSLRRLARDLRDTATADTAAARIIAAAARPRTPRLTGRLAASITPGPGRVDVTAPYAGVIHNGWPAHHIAGRPFVTQAAEASQPAWLAAYTAQIDRAVSRVRGA